MTINQQFAKWLASMPHKAFKGLIEALELSPVVSIRYNSLKGCHPADDADRVAWCPQGCYLAERPQFIFDPALHQGCYYVQDASSMAMSHVVEQLTADGKPRLMLDACAAPGGKTTAAIDALPRGSMMLANEYSPQRVGALRENLSKWGYPLVRVFQGDTSRFRAMASTFDIISADVPCSGEGMMRKDADAVEQWTPQLPVECARRQREILDNLWPALKPGGYLIYSTCTFNTQENEEMVGWIVENYGAESVEVKFPEESGIVTGIDTPHFCYRFMPNNVRGEGLFMAVLRKPVRGEDIAIQPRKNKKQERESVRKGKPNSLLQQVAACVDPQWRAQLSIEGDRIMATMRPDVDVPSELLPMLEVGTMKGNDWLPSPQLALSMALCRGAFPEVEVDRDTALTFLRREALQLSDAPRGVVLLTYQHHPLGFVKNLGNRANNLYHPSWRILSRG